MKTLKTTINNFIKIFQMNIYYKITSSILFLIFTLLFLEYHFSFKYLFNFIKENNDLYLYFVENNDHFQILPKTLLSLLFDFKIIGVYLLIISLIAYNLSKSKIFLVITVILILNADLLHSINIENLKQLIVLSLVVFCYQKYKNEPKLDFYKKFFSLIILIILVFLIFEKDNLIAFYNSTITSNETSLNYKNNFFEITNNNNFKVIFKTETNFILFLSLLSVALLIYLNPLFIASFIFFLVLYCQSVILSSIGKTFNMSSYLPLVIILSSITYFSISQYLIHEKFLKFERLLAILILVTVIFNTFFITLNKSYRDQDNFENKIQRNEVFQSYDYLKKLNFQSKYKNPLICKGWYSVVPKNFSTNILKSRDITKFKLQINNKECEFIILDWSTPGRYIWFENEPENLIIPSNFNNFDNQELRSTKTQKLVQYLLNNINSGYEINYFNSLIMILNKK